ncbi:PTS sugar transporter subunit IIB [Orenia marismortui]|uniref:PTS system IIB component (L-Asc family) n=1 Tax=Orenia marismortui TaxID=46469 RepID=A0A4R8GPF4_9FIRM|nr:PTS sugar transporter subunit IIB [Orenia marismortui]TDX45184.1 PTS system IIB component (L-Asc family) [Orenia marismortui]
MKILAVCGSGLGSSFMLEMNIKDVLTEIGIEAEVDHSDLASATQDVADWFVMGKDIANSAPHLNNVISLDSIIDKEELKQKLEETLVD